MSDIHNTKDNSDKIAEEARIARRMRENTLQLKLRNAIQTDEQTKINLYSEGFCYKCSRVDRILPSIFHVCAACTYRRGREGLYGPPIPKRVMELCDFCAVWKNSTSQINCGLCDKCMRQVHELHRKYRRTGGAFGNNPVYKKLRNKYGKNWMSEIMPHLRRI